MIKTLAMVSASAMTLVLAQGAFAQAPAAQSAQAKPAEEQTGIADIVVTATRQATNLQSTPIAITAVTAFGVLASAGAVGIVNSWVQTPISEPRMVVK